MATYCPNPACNLRLKFTDWKPACPKCGVNIQFYRIEERLDDEADHVELASAAFNMRMNRTKSALFNGSLAKLRFHLEIFAPLGLLAIPVGVHAIMAAMADGDFMANFWPRILNFMDLNDPASLFSGNIWLLLGTLGLGLAFPLLWLTHNVCKLFGGGVHWFGRAMIINGAGAAGAGLALASYLIFTTEHPGVFQPFVVAALAGLTLSYLLILLTNLAIRRQGGVEARYTPSWVAFTPAEEVYDYITGTGKTVKDFRAEQAAAQGEQVKSRKSSGGRCSRCGSDMLHNAQCQYCKLHDAALEKYTHQKEVAALLAQRRAGGNWKNLEASSL